MDQQLKDTFGRIVKAFNISANRMILVPAKDVLELCGYSYIGVKAMLRKMTADKISSDKIVLSALRVSRGDKNCNANISVIASEALASIKKHDKDMFESFVSEFFSDCGVGVKKDAGDTVETAVETEEETLRIADERLLFDFEELSGYAHILSTAGVTTVSDALNHEDLTQIKMIGESRRDEILEVITRE